MSYWTYVRGVITVEPMGRTQAEKRYILNTVLEHLPLVTGSERDMSVYVIQKEGRNFSSSHDEFGERTNNLVDDHGYKSRERGSLQMQNAYILVVDGALRDRFFDDTFREFQKWLCRLAKRVPVFDVLVEVRGYGQQTIVRDSGNVYLYMFEDPSWTKRKGENPEPNWCEYLMWDRMKNYSYPMKLGYKYFQDEENDTEVERRMGYLKRRNGDE